MNNPNYYTTLLYKQHEQTTIKRTKPNLRIRSNTIDLPHFKILNSKILLWCPKLKALSFIHICTSIIS
ncbi:hypothetical protein HanXRQr2_Chr08g0329261 [Helianthus annuus]|uniref:Uncharacterized protein n=1 Tax=Helianthus annuus TaxID=4232 RepID=A0A9K3ICR7_HELAN|nr:hypothetical protein HanXRQr2_Chr08g0329261 [Helianthus annuus]